MTETNEVTLETLRQAAEAGNDATGAPLPVGDQPYFASMLAKIEDGEHWTWPGKMHGGSPVVTWPGYVWGSMTRRKVWRIATGSEAGEGTLSLRRACTESRCVRPHREHIVQSPYPKGGGGKPSGGARKSRRGAFLEPTTLARAVHSLIVAARTLRIAGIDPHEFVCGHHQVTGEPNADMSRRAGENTSKNHHLGTPRGEY